MIIQTSVRSKASNKKKI